ncbi:MAG TPA: SCO family protein [bacterium]|nr:SCO family protein [bacterium]
MADIQRLPGRFVIFAMGGLLIIALVGAYMVHLSSRDRLALPVIAAVPDFTLTERDGSPFTRDSLMGKISVVDFIFTRCPGVCPVMADRMSRLYKLFEGRRDIQFVSITVDPEYDTPEVLREYAARQGVTDRRWLFLRGDTAAVAALSEKGFLLPTGALPEGHSSKFVLVDARGQIRGYYSTEDESSQLLLQHHIRALSTAMKQFPGGV